MKLRLLLPLVLPLLGLGFAVAEDAADEGTAAPAAAPAVTVPFHGNAVCPVQHKPARRDKFVEQDGERVYVCCNMCRTKVRGDFATYRDQAYRQQEPTDLANARCPISGKSTAGSAATVVFQDVKVRLCCDACAAKFLENPRRHLVLLQEDVVPLNNRQCLVMPEEGTDPAIFFVYDGVLIDSCCGDCADLFGKEPARYLKEAGVDLAAVKRAATKSG